MLIHRHRHNSAAIQRCFISGPLCCSGRQLLFPGRGGLPGKMGRGPFQVKGRHARTARRCAGIYSVTSQYTIKQKIFPLPILRKNGHAQPAAHSPKRVCTDIEFEKTTHFRHFLRRRGANPCKKEICSFSRRAPCAAQSRTGRAKRGAGAKNRAGNFRPCARGPRPGLRRKKHKKGRAGPAACPAPLKRVMRQNFTAEPPFSFSAPALRRPFAFVPARAAYSVGHAPAVCASTSSACPAAASLAAGWVFTWLAGC